MSKIRQEADRAGFDFKIAVDDETFIAFLKRRSSKYKRLIAVTCPYTFTKIAAPVHLVLGLSGFVIPLKGDVCTSEDKYVKGIQGKKSGQTEIDIQAFHTIMARIAAKKS